MNLKEFFNHRRTTPLFNYRLLDSYDELYPFFLTSKYDFIHEQIDGYMIRKYENLKINDAFAREIYMTPDERSELPFNERYDMVFIGFMADYGLDLQRIYNSLNVDYDVFENFSTIRTIKTENGVRKQTNVYGEEKQTNNYDDRVNVSTQDPYTDSITHGATNDTVTHSAYTDSMQHGQQKTTDVFGQDKTTNAYGQSVDTIKSEKTKDTSIHKVNGYDNGVATDYTDENTHESLADGENTRGAHTDTITTDSKTNTSTKDSYTDTNSVGAHTDTTIGGEHTDSNSVGLRKTTNETHKYSDVVTQDAHTDTVTQDADISTVTETFKGNQGVSITNQVLVKNEIDLRTNFKFYDIMFKMFLPYISGGIWE